MFTWSTGGWQSSQLPLSYQFGYVMQSSNFVVQSASQQSVASSVLPSASSTYSDSGMDSTTQAVPVTCFVLARDPLQASSTIYATVAVAKSNKTLELLGSLLAGLSSNDIHGATKLISIGASVVNAANCSGLYATPLYCAGLNRRGCSSTANTCSECLDGFQGEFGHYNSACWPTLQASGATASATASATRIAVTSHETSMGSAPIFSSLSASKKRSSSPLCSANQDCIYAYELCNTTSRSCYHPQRSCPNGCSNNGKCLFVDIATSTVIGSCLAGSPQCEARCNCAFGYFGTTCAHSKADYGTMGQLRATLLARLAVVSGQVSRRDGIGFVSLCVIMCVRESVYEIDR